MLYDTIAAPATGEGAGAAVGIIRLSGNQAVEIADKVFSKRLSESESRYLQYGKIYDSEGNILDDCLAVKMTAPNSYTGEDTVEFYIHGGKTVRECVFKELIKNGARIAERGEFTKRAFLNGKIDLTQAESVIDTINAPTKKALTFAQNNLDGKLRRNVEKIRTDIMNVIMGILAGNDFPDETGGHNNDEIIKTLENISQNISRLAVSFDSGKLIRNGLTCGLFGKPNVGKSSLLNALLEEDRAIVTDIPGTTRDIITEAIDIGGYAVNIADTAGLRESDDIVEKAGIEKTKNIILGVDFMIYMLDVTTVLNDIEKEHLKTAEANKIIVLNKCDIQEPSKEMLEFLGNFTYICKISAKNNIGIEELVSVMEKFVKQKTEVRDSGVFAERHFEALWRANEAVTRSISALKNDFEPDICSIDLEEAAASMGEITGQTVNDEVIDNIFKNFCIGK